MIRSTLTRSGGFTSDIDALFSSAIPCPVATILNTAYIIPLRAPGHYFPQAGEERGCIEGAIAPLPILCAATGVCVPFFTQRFARWVILCNATF